MAERRAPKATGANVATSPAERRLPRITKAASREDELMIRWEQQEDGSWLGLSGEFVVATVTRDEGKQGQWLWTITALNRPKGWRKGTGHRTSALEARGAADDYWSRWLEGAALRPDIMRLAQESIKADRASKRADRKRAGVTGRAAAYDGALEAPPISAASR